MATMELTENAIIPRNVSFNISQNPVRHWANGDPIRTASIDCLSIFLPEGERFFIRSLRHYVKEIKNEEVRAEINGYSVQEAFHTREHEDYNRSLSDLGYDVESMEQPVRDLLRNEEPSIINLATTCAIEHITMCFSMATLGHERILQGAAQQYRRLWTWHAVEELEHSAVSLDVYDEVTAEWSSIKRYLLRVIAMNAVNYHMARIQLRNMARYLVADGAQDGVRLRLRILWALWVSPGILSCAFGDLLRYYLPGYRPKPKRYMHLLEQGRRYIGREIPELGADSVPLASPALKRA
jgi:predicted metal-dependent hydrolase